MIDLLSNLDQTEKYILMASGVVVTSAGLLVFLVGTSILISATLDPNRTKQTLDMAGLVSEPDDVGATTEVTKPSNEKQPRALVLPVKVKALLQ